MALNGWLVDTSAAARSSDPDLRRELDDLSGQLFVCSMGLLEQLYSARSASDYDWVRAQLHLGYRIAHAPPDVLDRALLLQHDLAHHHGLWHRLPVGDLIIAETALYHELGIVHVNSDFERIAAVRPSLIRRRLSTP